MISRTPARKHWQELLGRCPGIRNFANLGIDPEKVNPLGGAIALGHPLGATGTILSITCAHSLRRDKKRYGLVTMCIGGGQGISLVLEVM